MNLVIYKKSTKHIVQVRHDSSTVPNSAANWFNVYIKDIRATAEQAADLTYVEIRSPIEISLLIGKHLWNETTQQVDEDPAYVEPPAPQEIHA